MAAEGRRVGDATLLGSLAAAGLALRHSLAARGARRTARFAALALGLPSLAEWYAVNIDRGLRHHTRPRLAGVPLGAALGWWAIGSATHGLVEAALAGAGVGDRARRWLAPPGTALVATGLDLALDPFGLALGLWEWRDGGPYAREIAGPNGRRGIPVENYVAWLAIVGGVAALDAALAGPTPPPDPAAARAAAPVALAYALPPALWALARRRPGYLPGLTPLALTIALALRRRGGR